MKNPFPKSFFYTPATNIKNIFKAQELKADVAVIDLEDSIPATEKTNARTILKEFLSKDDFYPIRAIRINSIRNKYGIDDLHWLLNLECSADIIIMTMVEDAEEVTIIKNILLPYFSNLKIYVTIETGLAISKSQEIASIANGLIFGSADYAALLGVDITWENMLFGRYQIVSSAATYNIPAIDTACYCFDPIEALIEECKMVRSLGFTGKAAVHPSQVNVINESFSLSQRELNQAKRIVKAFEGNQLRIKNVDGQMIGPPFIAKAKKILSRHLQQTREEMDGQYSRND